MVEDHTHACVHIDSLYVTCIKQFNTVIPHLLSCLCISQVFAWSFCFSCVFDWHYKIHNLYLNEIGILGVMLLDFAGLPVCSKFLC